MCLDRSWSWAQMCYFCLGLPLVGLKLIDFKRGSRLKSSLPTKTASPTKALVWSPGSWSKKNFTKDSVQICGKRTQLDRDFVPGGEVCLSKTRLLLSVVSLSPLIAGLGSDLTTKKVKNPRSQGPVVDSFDLGSEGEDRSDYGGDSDGGGPARIHRFHWRGVFSNKSPNTGFL